MKSDSLRRSPSYDASNPVREPLLWADEQEEAKIVDACKKGDTVAQRRLYDVLHQNVYRLIVRMVGKEDAIDVTQQAFLQVFRKINQFAGRSQIATWVYRVSVNEALQHLRKSKRSKIQILEQEPMDRSPSCQESIEHRDLLEQALELLVPELKAAFLLREMEGLAYSDIAVALDIPEGTVGSRLNRARRELKQQLIELGWES